MNLTARQREIYEKIRAFDKDWHEESFATAWNDILKLNKYISITDGKLALEFGDLDYTTIKFLKNDEILLEEKIHWNEFIDFDKDSPNEIKQLANSIKTLAERIIVS
jgi:hypothetical protein